MEQINKDVAEFMSRKRCRIGEMSELCGFWILVNKTLHRERPMFYVVYGSFSLAWK